MHIIYKKIGETSLEALKRFRKEAGKLEETLSYAGRLDPMASGQLLLLEGEENDRRDDFLDLDKNYEFSILFGATTDTFDLLGLVELAENTDLPLTVNRLNEVLQSFIGKWEMVYPPYSAQTIAVDGKKIPLWQLARANCLPSNLPTKDVEVYEASCMEITEITTEDVLNYIETNIPKVSGDFRQEEIIARWQQVLADADKPLQLAHCSVSGSAGLYVRRLAYEVGSKLSCPSLAFSIDRTAIDVPENLI
ncbi:MAG: hypothetical protein WD552_02545 [Candidatus Paceibacterota bacterium]